MSNVQKVKEWIDKHAAADFEVVGNQVRRE